MNYIINCFTWLKPWAKIYTMPHSYNKIWIHAIWSTKDRYPFLEPTIRTKVINLISEQLKELGCLVGIVNGMPDHIHCLFMLSPEKSIAEVLKQLKGSSSFRLNKEGNLNSKFAWQTGYAAFSVSESVKEKVYQYIKNQEIHHKNKTFQQEYEAFLRLYELE